MLKILTIIGARPQIIKAAALSRAIRNNYKDKLTEIILHTGQHYDENMSEVFFKELEIPRPNYNLNVGSGAHGAQTAAMIKGIEEALEKEKPHCLVVYGDTNSTLAGAIAASKIHVPVVHIEAGLRSFNKSMPEEINRILCDHVSTLLFSPTSAGYNNLVKEGFKENNQPPYHIDNPKIYHCGDIMYDNSLYFAEKAGKQEKLLEEVQVKKEGYMLVTIHRNSNTDEPQRLNSLFSAIIHLAEENNIPAVIPIHPRTSKMMEQHLEPELLKKVKSGNLVKLIPPASFLDMIVLEKNCRIVLTDSGGVQKEAFFFKRPCIVLRPESEWVEITQNGNNILADADEQRIISAFNRLINKKDFTYPPLFGDGKAAEFICAEILRHIPVQ